MDVSASILRGWQRALLVSSAREYSKINWRFGWPAPVVGASVFLLWIALDRISGVTPTSGIPSDLAAWPMPARTTWIVFRTLAAVVTVPIAEELAFRGFLLRRLISADFDSCPVCGAGLCSLRGGIVSCVWVAAR